MGGGDESHDSCGCKPPPHKGGQSAVRVSTYATLQSLKGAGLQGPEMFTLSSAGLVGLPGVIPAKAGTSV